MFYCNIYSIQYDVMNFGCIPVVLSDEMLYAFTEVLTLYIYIFDLFLICFYFNYVCFERLYYYLLLLNIIIYLFFLFFFQFKITGGGVREANFSLRFPQKIVQKVCFIPI